MSCLVVRRQGKGCLKDWYVYTTKTITPLNIGGVGADHATRFAGKAHFFPRAGPPRLGPALYELPFRCYANLYFLIRAGCPTTSKVNQRVPQGDKPVAPCPF